MPANIRIYIEGDRKLLPGFRRFFGELYDTGAKVEISVCGANAVADFMNSVRKFPEAVNILLIDAEGPYTPALLQQVRQHDHWDAAAGRRVSNDQLHFMVQVMESWFLADRPTLREYYGREFAENRLPANPAVEQVPKDDVLGSLAAATRPTARGRYHKTRHASDLLATINPATVAASAPACARLFNFLQSIIALPN